MGTALGYALLVAGPPLAAYAVLLGRKPFFVLATLAR
jgi:hypothetical protein